MLCPSSRLAPGSTAFSRGVRRPDLVKLLLLVCRLCRLALLLTLILWCGRQTQIRCLSTRTVLEHRRLISLPCTVLLLMMSTVLPKKLVALLHCPSMLVLLPELLLPLRLSLLLPFRISLLLHQLLLLLWQCVPLQRQLCDFMQQYRLSILC